MDFVDEQERTVVTGFGPGYHIPDFLYTRAHRNECVERSVQLPGDDVSQCGLANTSTANQHQLDTLH